MNKLGKMAAIAALVLVAGCEVNVDNDLEASIENGAEDLGADLENAAADAGETIEGAAGAVENRLDALGDDIDIDVNLNDRDNAAETNSQ